MGRASPGHAVRAELTVQYPPAGPHPGFTPLGLTRAQLSTSTSSHEPTDSPHRLQDRVPSLSPGIQSLYPLTSETSPASPSAVTRMDLLSLDTGLARVTRTCLFLSLPSGLCLSRIFPTLPRLSQPLSPCRRSTWFSRLNSGLTCLGTFWGYDFFLDVHHPQPPSRSWHRLCCGDRYCHTHGIHRGGQSRFIIQ